MCGRFHSVMWAITCSCFFLPFPHLWFFFPNCQNNVYYKEKPTMKFLLKKFIEVFMIHANTYISKKKLLICFINRFNDLIEWVMLGFISFHLIKFHFQFISIKKIYWRLGCMGIDPFAFQNGWRKKKSLLIFYGWRHFSEIFFASLVVCCTKWVIY